MNDDNLEDEDNWPDELHEALQFNLDGPTSPPCELPNLVVDEEE